jgi:hypothetical protein
MQQPAPKTRRPSERGQREPDRRRPSERGQREPDRRRPSERGLVVWGWQARLQEAQPAARGQPAAPLLSTARQT